MHSVNLRQVGGSVMLAVPPAVLEMLSLKVGVAVEMDVDRHRLIVQSAKKSQYTLEGLLALCDVKAEISPHDSEWLNDAPIGNEVI